MQNINIKTKKLNISNMLISLVIVIDYINGVFPNYETYLNIINVCIIFLIYFLFYYNKIAVMDILVLFVSALLIILNSDISRISLFVFYILLLKNEIYNRNTIKVVLVTSLICMITILVAYILGFNKKYDTTIWRPLFGRTVSRMSFGFTHPNQFMIRIFTIFLLLFAYTRNRLIKILFLFFVILFYFFTQSRTVPLVILLVVCLMILVDCFSKLFKHKNVKLYKVLPYMFFIMTVVSVLISLLFADSRLDLYLSGRLRINKNFLLNYFSFWGTKSLESKTFDNSYIHMILTKGMIYFLIYAGVLVQAISKKTYTIEVTILLISIFIFGFMEVIFLKYPIMLCMGILINMGKRRVYGSKSNKLLLVWKQRKERTC